MEPQDVRASEGMSRLVLHCRAEGFPKPAVTWRRASGKKPGNYQDISYQDFGIHPDGSLVFGRVQEDHEGFYLCEAVNGIGPGLSKVVHLMVNGKMSPTARSTATFAPQQSSFSRPTRLTSLGKVLKKVDLWEAIEETGG